MEFLELHCKIKFLDVLAIHGKKPRPAPYLNHTEEEELEFYLVEAAQMGYGKTYQQVIRIAENVASRQERNFTLESCNKYLVKLFKGIPLYSGDARAQDQIQAITHKNLTHYIYSSKTFWLPTLRG